MSKSPLRKASCEKLADRSIGDKIHRATLRTLDKRAQMVAQIPGWQQLRQNAREVRLRALDHQAALLEEFQRKLRDRGVHVSVVDSVEQAQRTITELVLQAGKRVTKSKSMASEEIHLNEALEAAGAQVTETDLGELIVQLAHQSPSHVTAPAIHLSVEDIARIFHDKLGIKPPRWVEQGEQVEETTRVQLATQMSLAARRVLRERFLRADVGISGANFLVAESGTVVLLENEGNIQLTTCLPKRHIVLAGIEKLVSTEAALATLLQLLPVSATAQRQTCYVSLFADPHPDMHVVLLDHGRSALLQDDEQRDLLTCIRCGACMNVCPVYRNIGGHAYGGAYPGPLGALLLPALEGYERHADLPFASSLCGACSEICPVAIPLHERLLQLRARLVRKGLARELGWTLQATAELMKSEALFHTAGRAYGHVRGLATLSPAGRAWTSSRTLPEPPSTTFHAWYERNRASGHAPSPPQPQGQIAAPSATSEQQTAVLEATRDQAWELFRQRLLELGPCGETELHLFPKEPNAKQFLHRLMAEHPSDTILVQGERSEKKDYELGITYAALAIADTGGIVLDVRERIRGRASTLVDTQVAVIQRERIVNNLTQALRERSLLRAQGLWGDYQVIVTGPSRTADIEKVLVIPAHGPRRLIVVVCDEPVKLESLR